MAISRQTRFFCALAAFLREMGMSHALRELEIPESTLMHDADNAMLTLKAFEALDVRLVIADFGTGFSSLFNLRQLPIDAIKIDGSFIRDVDTDPENRSIAEAIIAMGRTLNLTFVAECVETEAQKEFLHDQACDQHQGFYFSKASPAREFSDWLEARNALAPAGA
jgi:EAL domain-containing protein (putative c-di-GMP-specific phosphodiesterase class I)